MALPTGAGGRDAARHRGGHGHYTRIVRLLRWLLPACALVLAVTLLVWPSLHLIELPEAMPVMGLDQPTSERSTMTNVRFLGTDREGLPFTIRAGKAWHDSGQGEVVFLDDVSGRIVVGGGKWTTVRSDRGFYDQADQVLTLESSVQVSTSDGYRFSGERVLIDLDKGTATSDTVVRGEGPSGALEARGFRVTDGGGKFTFLGGVHLTLVPESKP